MMQNVSIGTFLKTLIKIQSKGTPNTYIQELMPQQFLREYLSVFKCELKLFKRLGKNWYDGSLRKIMTPEKNMFF